MFVLWCNAAAREKKMTHPREESVFWSGGREKEAAKSGNELEDITEKETRERNCLRRKHADDFSYACWIVRSEHFTPSAEI
jgi:hypothetical protein